MHALPITKLIEEFAKLPGIGKRSAERLAFYILKQPKVQVENFAKTLMYAKENITFCPICQSLTDRTPCSICDNPKRDHSIVCVVENPKDILAMEKTREFSGVYHVLHGVISPMDGIGPEDIKIKELLVRMENEPIREIIMATNPTIEGEATAMYISKLFKPFDVKVTRIAHGIPVGGELEYADEITITRALEGRHEI